MVWISVKSQSLPVQHYSSLEKYSEILTHWLYHNGKEAAMRLYFCPQGTQFSLFPASANNCLRDMHEACQYCNSYQWITIAQLFLQIFFSASTCFISVEQHFCRTDQKLTRNQKLELQQTTVCRKPC